MRVCEWWGWATWLIICWRKIHAKFSGKPRDARQNRGIQPSFGRFLIKIDVKTQNKTLAKFQILASESKLKNQSSFRNRFKIDLQNRSLLFLSNLVSRHQNSNSPPSIWSESSSLNFSSYQNLDFVLGLFSSSSSSPRRCILSSRCFSASSSAPC